MLGSYASHPQTRTIMATQVMGQSSGGGSLFGNTATRAWPCPCITCMTSQRLSWLHLSSSVANVALTGGVDGSCCDYLVGEEKQVAKWMPVGDNSFSHSEGEGLEELAELKGDPSGLENMKLRSLELSAVEPQPVFEASAAPEMYSTNKDPTPETPVAEDITISHAGRKQNQKNSLYITSEFTVLRSFLCAEKQAKARESGSSPAEEGEFSKGPIRSDRCGYNTNRYVLYKAHRKHRLSDGDNEHVYKCIICTYTTVSE